MTGIAKSEMFRNFTIFMTGKALLFLVKLNKTAVHYKDKMFLASCTLRESPQFEALFWCFSRLNILSRNFKH